MVASAIRLNNATNANVSGSGNLQNDRAALKNDFLVAQSLAEESGVNPIGALTAIGGGLWWAGEQTVKAVQGLFESRSEKPNFEPRKPQRKGAEDRRPDSGTERNVGGHHGAGNDNTEHGRKQKGPPNRGGGAR